MVFEVKGGRGGCFSWPPLPAEAAVKMTLPCDVLWSLPPRMSHSQTVLFLI